MITTELLFRLFCRHVEKAGAEKDLTDDEKNRIISVFQAAITDPYMNEYQIYPKITGDHEFTRSYTLYD